MWLILTTVITAPILWYILRTLTEWHQKLTYWQRQRVRTPGLISQWHNMRRELGPYDQELHQKLGPIYGTYQGLTPILVIADPSLVKEVLVKEFHNFPNHKPMKTGLSIIDLSMFALDGGDDWKRIRSIISPTFTSGKLRNMDYLVKESIDILKTHFAKAATEGVAINVRKYYNSLSFDAILRCAYSANVDILTDTNHPIFFNMENLFSADWRTIVYMISPKLLSYLPQSNQPSPIAFFQDMAKKLLDERKNSTQNQNHKDFVQLMIDTSKEAEAEEDGTDSSVPARKGISDIEMMAQCLIFLIAGFDTTATIMACCAYHLAKNPDVQDKLIAEVSKVNEVTHDSVTELKYLEAVLKESFRLTPPVIRIERECVSAVMIGNISIQPGTIVSVPLYALQRDPKYFTNPEVFDPERFLEGGTDVNHHPYAYLPFGGGPRMCIAQRFALMEAKMALALVFQEYRFEETTDTKLTFAPASFDLLAPKEIMLKVRVHS